MPPEMDEFKLAEITKLKRLKKIVESLPSERVAIFGDVILDRYIYGSAENISSSAPVPVVVESSRKYSVGGTAHIWAGLQELGLHPVFFGVVGNDEAGGQALEMLADKGVGQLKILTMPGRITTAKTRVYAERPKRIEKYQQLLQVDKVGPEPLPDDSIEQLINSCIEAIAESKVLVISDYDKGVVTDYSASRLMEAAKEAGVPVIFDPKLSGLHRTEGATLTIFETRGMELMRRRLGEDTDETTAQRLIEKYKWDGLLVVGGPSGVHLHRMEEAPLHLPCVISQPTQILGLLDAAVVAGVIASCGNCELIDSAYLANLACETVMMTKPRQDETHLIRRDFLLWIDERTWQLQISQR